MAVGEGSVWDEGSPVKPSWALGNGLPGLVADGVTFGADWAIPRGGGDEGEEEVSPVRAQAVMARIGSVAATAAPRRCRRRACPRPRRPLCNPEYLLTSSRLAQSVDNGPELSTFRYRSFGGIDLADVRESQFCAGTTTAQRVAKPEGLEPIPPVPDPPVPSDSPDACQTSLRALSSARTPSNFDSMSGACLSARS